MSTMSPDDLASSLAWQRAPGTIRTRRYDGPGVLAELDRWVRLHEQVYGEDLARPDHSDPSLADRLRLHAGRPGFELVAAFVQAADADAGTFGAAVGRGTLADRGTDDEEIAGYVYGYTLPVDTLWWHGLKPPADPAVVREHPGRTVGLCEALIGPEFQRAGIGERLFYDFLAGRPEERAAALVATTNTVILDRFAAHGWSVLGELEPYPGWSPHAALVCPLR
jgi:ribosomal protein S18 acetylase RimI-like enzyme